MPQSEIPCTPTISTNKSIPFRDVFFCVMKHYFFELVRTPECTKVTPFGIAYRIRSIVDTPVVPAGTLGGFVTEDVQFESIGAWVSDDAMALSTTRLTGGTLLKGNAISVGSALSNCVLSDNAKVFFCTIDDATLTDNATLSNTWSSIELHLSGNFFGRSVSFGRDDFDYRPIYADTPCEEGERLITACACNHKEGARYFDITIAVKSAMVHIADTGISLHVSELLENAHALVAGKHAVVRRNMYRAIVSKWADTVLASSRVTALSIECRRMLARAQKESWIHEHPWRTKLSEVKIK